LLNTLSKSPFLAECQLNSSDLFLCHYQSNQIINDCPKGIPAVGFIKTGQVDVYSISIDGRDVQLNSLVANDCFGISNLLAQTLLNTVLRCCKDTTIIYIRKDALLRNMQKNAALSLKYATLCNKKLQFLICRIELLTMESCRGKIIAYLLNEKSENNQVFLKCSKENLACHLGISRATLFREFAYLRSKKALHIKNSIITILNLNLLELLLYNQTNERN